MSDDEPAGPSFNWIGRVGIGAWSFVGFVVALGIVVSALGAINEIVLPLTFAAVLAVIFRPLAGSLQTRGLKPTLAAGVVVLGLLALTTVVVVATVRGLVDQVGAIGDSVDQALENAAGSLEIDQDKLDSARSTIEAGAPGVSTGFLTQITEGIHTAVGLASGIILGALIMYYLLKDGGKLRRQVVAAVPESSRPEVDDFIGSTCTNLRAYGKGRTVMSSVVAVVIGVASLLMGLPLVFTIIVANFIGGYIPYIGAFLGGGLAVMVALGEGGITSGAIMLVIVLASNLLLENFVEPKVMGKTLDVHPLVVLVATALGGLLGGIVGLILAVPFFVILRDAVGRLRAAGFFGQVATAAEPTVRRVMS